MSARSAVPPAAASPPRSLNDIRRVLKSLHQANEQVPQGLYDTKTLSITREGLSKSCQESPVVYASRFWGAPSSSCSTPNVDGFKETTFIVGVLVANVIMMAVGSYPPILIAATSSIAACAAHWAFGRYTKSRRATSQILTQ